MRSIVVKRSGADGLVKALLKGRNVHDCLEALSNDEKRLLTLHLGMKHHMTYEDYDFYINRIKSSGNSAVSDSEIEKRIGLAQGSFSDAYVGAVEKLQRRIVGAVNSKMSIRDYTRQELIAADKQKKIEAQKEQNSSRRILVGYLDIFKSALSGMDVVLSAEALDGLYEGKKLKVESSGEDLITVTSNGIKLIMISFTEGGQQPEGKWSVENNRGAIMVSYNATRLSKVGLRLKLLKAVSNMLDVLHTQLDIPVDSIEFTCGKLTVASEVVILSEGGKEEGFKVELV